MCCWIWFASTLSRVFVYIFIKENWSLILFWLYPYLVLVSVCYWLCRISVEVFLLFLFHGIVWGALVIFPLQRSGEIQQSIHIVLSNYFWHIFSIWMLLLLLVLVISE
jgi:hypothetical protein